MIIRKLKTVVYSLSSSILYYNGGWNVHKHREFDGYLFFLLIFGKFV